MSPDQPSLSLLLSRLDDLEQLVANHQKALSAMNQMRARDGESIGRIARIAAEGHMFAKTLRAMREAELGSKFAEQWEEAYKAAFPPPPQQSDAAIERVAAQLREENKREVNALREQFEIAMNKLVKAMERPNATPPANVIPMPEQAQDPTPKPQAHTAPKSRPKQSVNKQKPAESRDGVGVDRDEPV